LGKSDLSKVRLENGESDLEKFRERRVRLGESQSGESYLGKSDWRERRVISGKVRLKSGDS
jgi:hypothetical protein